MKSILNLVECGAVPDFLVRQGIRSLCRQRLKDIDRHNPQKLRQHNRAFIQAAQSSPVAIETDAANDQHYELPTEFFQLVLGKYLKYSCSYYKHRHQTLTDAEEDTLAIYAERAKLSDGQRILDLGCGWGSMSLYMAKKYPNAQITAVSNSLLNEHTFFLKLKNIT